MNKLKNLRRKLHEAKVDGMLIAMADPFQNDNIPEYFQRIKFLSGFTGSLGTILVLKDSAALFVDGRYTLQAQNEVDPTAFEIRGHGLSAIVEWIHEKQLSSSHSLVIGYDPWDYTVAQINQLQAATESVTFSPLKINLVSEIWKDQPAITKTKVFLYPEKYAGLSWIEKLDLIAAEIQKKNIDALFLNSSFSICWLLNMRAHDTSYTPISLCFALIHKTGKVDLCIYLENLTPAIKKHFSERVTFHNLSSVDLKKSLPILVKGLKIGYVEQSAPCAIKQILELPAAALINVEDPCVAIKACKTPTELSHVQKAHLWDGIALTKFFCWLEKTVSSKKITEFEAALKLDSLRAENKHCKGPSFPTIVGTNENGAIVHYRANEESKTLKVNDLLLCDSGGQYFEGTTDVTRTICLGGNPTPLQKDVFTRVLKGFIALFLVHFPKGTNGMQLDVLARCSLWEAGFDYAHSTGHGVGHYLNVHEGPQNISPRSSPTPLKPGMILSNEPGCYLPGQFGVRIENLMVVEKSSHKDSHGNFLLKFRNLTLCPIDSTCIEKTLLSDHEIDWLNKYHQTVWTALHKFLNPNEKAWLKTAIAPFEKKDQAFSHQDSMRDSIIS
ncbi:MAG: hypothetical protein A2977_00375 [Alphaproteobacteria bacterium RIFCSPLOWO2_01_FULL_45_8]|nr:MAG: hypothetical protein A2065_02590 [Alphaproteobacteria bacterium GWB1_45_5]OFW75890.1 MAG: hypothetical protein A3K20_03620 [Alphaproteobacteria bacterium GWA1_45_9]OFW89982.1 MAG: hypothetical protein A2621_03825 [Alphaproteobacteria bacterium RIFCSPHIGHO2_01_FULL_41_14]OFW96235.1 MAG: hypothetical protein A2977_00375 [Alphaproteobacteria bacterium RIFCSPLOWO2_01_FULL_45_8]HCI48515.1 X-Pro aminopeptidase [Holosporales bacterium]